MTKKTLIPSVLLALALCLAGCDAVTDGSTAATAEVVAATASAQFTGTVSEIVDPAAETGIPRRWMRHVGDPAPDGYSHGYQWGTPSITTPAGVVTFDGTIDLVDAGVDADGGDFGLIGLFDTATLAADERGLNEGSYIYLNMAGPDLAVVGLSDGRAAGGEYVQLFHTIDLTGTDRILDVTFSIDPYADPALCASSPADVATAEGCLTLQIDGLPLLTDSYGSITNDGANGGEEFVAGGTAGWDGLASSQDATGIDYDFTISPTVILIPESKDDCKKGGWQSLHRADGSTFDNQGECIQYVNTGR